MNSGREEEIGSRYAEGQIGFCSLFALLDWMNAEFGEFLYSNFYKNITLNLEKDVLG